MSATFQNLLARQSTNTPNRKKRLVTFSITKVHKQRVKVVERERRLSERFLKRQLAWINEKGLGQIDLDSLLGPISPLPRALIGENQLPYKANKSSATQYLTKRYHEVPVVIEYPPPQWAPHAAILEGMFMIQTTPSPGISCMKEYAELLMAQYVRPHLQAGSLEVHVIFDNPGSMSETPKEIEQKRRDSTASKKDANRRCTEITSNTPIQSNWRAFLECRPCKRTLTRYLGHELLFIAPKFLSSDQTFICNIGEVAQSTSHTGDNLPCPQLWTNADEADMRVWLHCIHSTGTRKLIFSPDTDVYHIGLAFVHLLQGMEVVIKSLREGSKFLLLHNLIRALENDPDMAGIPSTLRAQALQSLYVCTGCDYVSFFRGLGKVSFMTTFFQYASFIAGGF